MPLPTSVDFDSISRDLGLPLASVHRTAELLDEGNTVAFITRYRKDQTGGLDEQQIRAVRRAVSTQQLLAERKLTILKSIEAQGKLTDLLAEQIRTTRSTKRLEDLYLPYKPRKQTLATLARQRGLEPLAEEILGASIRSGDLEARAEELVSPANQLDTVADVLCGVGHLLAENYSERADLRAKLRKILHRTGNLVSTKIESGEDENTAPKSQAASESQATSGDSGSVDPPQSAQDVERSPAGDDSLAPDTAVQEQAAVSSNDSVAESDSSGPEGSDQAGGPAAAAIQESTDHASAPKAKAGRRSAKLHRRQRLEKALQDYFDFREPISKVPPHRVLAINRGERARVLRVRIEGDSSAMHEEAASLLVDADHPHCDFLRGCVRDALVRLVFPSLEREIRRELTERAEEHAVRVFARNLRKLLLQPPVRGRRVLAIDPGFRSGCQLATLDEFGNVLGSGELHVIGNDEQRCNSQKQLAAMIDEHQVTVVAIGNGTACRATEQFVAETIDRHISDEEIAYVIVNEAGASVYSTSPVGREELPDIDAVQRSTISIGRRLLDPLSELVKITPANIGVGLYQHDIKAKHLRDSLDEVVASCVNFVGVDVNTASPALLSYVSGLNQLTARRIYDYRLANGPFRNRRQILEVPGIGEATFVQAAGFLKIVQGDNPLDATWIHPESYEVAERVLEKLGSSVDELAGALATTNRREEPAVGASSEEERTEQRNVTALAERASRVETASLAAELSIGELLLKDILNTLSKPGRDPREDLPPPVFRRGVVKLDDLKPGMELSGTVLNVVDFGAFVDIGISGSALVHISRLADHFIKDPHEVVSVGDVLTVWVTEVDRQRRRVSLSALDPQRESERNSRQSRKHPAAKPTARPKVASQGRRKTSRQAAAGNRRRGGGRNRPKPITPITPGMAEGSEPMRSFSDLLQFYERKNDSKDSEPDPEK
jgi:uncharacterized protein